MAKRDYKVLIGTVTDGRNKAVSARDKEPFISIDQEEGDKLVDKGVLEAVEPAAKKSVE